MKASLRLILWLSLALSGCSSLLNVQRQPFTIYSPRYTTPSTAPTGPRVDWQLAVETPLSSDTLNTARIVIMPRPGVIELYPGARWSDPAPALLRGLVVQGFENSGRIIGVGSSASGLRADYALAIDLHDFQAEIRDGTPHAAIRFQARLLDYSTNRVLAAQAFAADSPFVAKDPTSAFAAFEATVNQVVTQLVDWTLREGNAARQKSAPRS